MRLPRFETGLYVRESHIMPLNYNFSIDLSGIYRYAAEDPANCSWDECRQSGWI